MKEEVVHLLEKEINANHIPGAVLQVNHGGRIVLEEALGYRQVYPTKHEMNLDTMFDLASLTKVVATMTAILKLVDRGVVRLEDKVDDFLPSFSGGQRSELTLRHLLTHVSGYQASLPIDNRQPIHKEDCLRVILREPFHQKVNKKVVYSDINYVLLYLIIEEITQEPFAAFTKRELFEALNMHDTVYHPNKARYEFAATEYSEQVSDYKRGDVHDE